jgi:hypothetical protein
MRWGNLPAETFGAVTKRVMDRKGGTVRFLGVGRLVVAWRRDADDWNVNPVACRREDTGFDASNLQSLLDEFEAANGPVSDAEVDRALAQWPDTCGRCGGPVSFTTTNGTRVHNNCATAHGAPADEPRGRADTCDHEWSDRGGIDDRWRECWLCGAQWDLSVETLDSVREAWNEGYRAGIEDKDNLRFNPYGEAGL